MSIGMNGDKHTHMHILPYLTMDAMSMGICTNKSQCGNLYMGKIGNSQLFILFQLHFTALAGRWFWRQMGLSENRVPKIHQNPLVTSGYWLILALPNFTSYF